MIVFVSCNSKLTSHDFAQECIEKYLYLIKFTNKKIKTKTKIELLKFDKNKKPYINDELNISMTNKNTTNNKIYMVAISLKKVGIDCEIRYNIKNRDKILNKYFTIEEKRSCNSIYEFFKLWTQKEAIYKTFNNIEKIAAKIDTKKYSDNLTTFELYQNLIVSIYSEDKNIYVYEMEDNNSYGKCKKIDS